MTDTLAQALVAAQAEMPKVPKNGRNPHFNSQFVTLDDLLDAVRPVLNKHGIAIVQVPCNIEGTHPGLATMLIHGPSGEKLDATMPLVLQKQDMQGLGAAITYARRYMLAAALGIAEGVDDDGNQASARAPENARSRPETRVDGPPAYPVPKTWAKVQEAVLHCDNEAESWGIFQAFVRAAGYHLFGETDSKKLTKEQRVVILQKASGAAVWMHDQPHPGRQGEFLYFTEDVQRQAWAAVLDGTLLEIPDYKPAEPEDQVAGDAAEADRLAREYEAIGRDMPA